MLLDIFLIGYEIGVLKGKVKFGCIVVIVGVGFVGLVVLFIV